MIFKDGNLLDQVKPRNLVVHGCNAQSVMGSGVAKQIRARFPECYEHYVYELKKHREPLGSISIWEAIDGSKICNAITQYDYGTTGKKYVSYDAVDSCFTSIFRYALNENLTVHIPDMIGAGLGGGDADVIVAIIECAAVRNKFLLQDIYCWKFM